jgi:uncharacterized protein
MGRALITGATAGIGREFAVQLAAQGRDLVIVARDEARLQALAEELESLHGVDVEVLPADLRQTAALEKVEQRLRDSSKPVDVLINNAGFGIGKSFDRSDIDDEQAILDVMVTAVMRLSHAALPGMKERNRGGIIVVSSIAGFYAGGTYFAAKAWATTFARGLASQLRGTNVRVTALCPGFTRTEFHERGKLDASTISDWLWLSAEKVVADGLRDFEAGRTISVPGIQYKALTGLARVLPSVNAKLWQLSMKVIRR